MNDDRGRGWRVGYSPRSEISLSSHVRSITSGSTIASSPSVASGGVAGSERGGAGRGGERQKISKGEIEKSAEGVSGKARTCVLATRRARQALFLTLRCLMLDVFQRLALLPGRISIRGAFELRLERLSGNIALLPSGKLRDDVRASGDRGVLLPGRSRARRDGHLFFSDSLRTRLGDLTARALSSSRLPCRRW